MRCLPLLLLVSLSGCVAEEMCATILVGRDPAGLPVSRGFSSRPFGLGILSPASQALARNPKSFSTGDDVDHQLCCYTQSIGEPLGWCSAEQLECSDERFQGLDLAYVREPYSEQHSPEWASMCFVLIKDERIVAVFSRYWS